LGATLEFLTKEEVRRKYGQLKEIIGGGWQNLKPGEWTDDTEMMLAVAEGILANPHDPVQYIGEKFLEWFKPNPPDIGNTIRSVLIKYQELWDWHKAAEAVHKEGIRTAGNGALMRTLPLAFAYRDPAELYMMCTYGPDDAPGPGGGANLLHILPFGKGIFTREPQQGVCVERSNM